jgi:hypothetical protein
MSGQAVTNALLAVLAAASIAPVDAQAQSCRGYPESVRTQIKRQVERLQMIERESADRILGLDTRTYSYLADQARRAADAIADPRALALEDELKRCRNLVQPVRRICRDAVLSLAKVIDEQDAGAATPAAKQTYAGSMSECEKLMRLTPLRTALRAVD